MNYVFFDIECANCYQGKGKICSFGYVITDEQFNISEERDMLINPSAKFNLGPDIKLAYTKSEFNRAPLFPMFFDEIDAILTEPDTLVFGFSVNNDARYVRDECLRYELPNINFRFYDVQQMCMGYHDMKNQPSLAGLCEMYDIPESQEIHKSDDDARMTMKILKKLCEITNKSPQTLIEDFPKCVGELNDGILKWVNAPIKEVKPVSGTSKKKPNNKMPKFSPNFNNFKKYIASLEPESDTSERVFNGQKICVSTNYEERSYVQMKYIAKRIVNLGGSYTMTATDSDIFVTYKYTRPDGTEKICPRETHVREAIQNGKNIEVISFDELLCKLNITEEELAAVLDNYNKAFADHTENTTVEDQKKAEATEDNSIAV